MEYANWRTGWQRNRGGAVAHHRLEIDWRDRDGKKRILDLLPSPGTISFPEESTRLPVRGGIEQDAELLAQFRIDALGDVSRVVTSQRLAYALGGPLDDVGRALLAHSLGLARSPTSG